MDKNYTVEILVRRENKDYRVPSSEKIIYHNSTVTLSGDYLIVKSLTIEDDDFSEDGITHTVYPLKDVIAYKTF